MSDQKPLSAAFRPSRWQRRQQQMMKNKARQRAYLKSQGRHAEADFLLLTDCDKLPATFKDSFLITYG